MKTRFFEEPLSGTFPIAAYLQDYKINESDIDYIKKIIKKKNIIAKKTGKSLIINFYIGDKNNFFTIFNNLLENNTPEALLILKDFISIVTNFNDMPTNLKLEKENILQNIEKKAQYLALCDKVEEQVPTKPNNTPVRRNKI